MKTTASVECNNRTRVCQVAQKEFPGLIDLQCTSSECVDKIRDYKIPDESFLLYYISASVAVALVIILIVTLILTIIIDSFYTLKATKEWKSL